jgi:hypothetical protein
MKLIKVILSYILKFFHILFTIIAFIGPIMTNNIIVLAFIFVLNSFILFCWLIHDGVCFLSPLEQKLDDVNYRYSNGLTKNFIAVCLDKVFKNELITFILITIIPVVNILIILYKITSYKTMCDLNMAQNINPNTNPNINLVL